MHKTMKKVTNKGTIPTLNTNVSECSVCGEVFSSVSGFDKHRKGKYPNRVCRHPEDLGMTINSKGYWSVPLTETQIEKLRNPA